MTARGRLASIGIAGAVAAAFATQVPLSAHRLDEYLQATRLSVDVDRVGLEIDLTPGVSIAREVLGWIDIDGDGHISGAEADAYARQVLRSVTLSVDGRPVPIALTENRVPPVEEMDLGVGTIQLRAIARMPAVSGGQHRVLFSNTHHPERSVYLVNALVPSDSRIQIAGQQRDCAQHGMMLTYDVTASAQQTQPYWLVAIVVMAAALGVRRKYAKGSR